MGALSTIKLLPKAIIKGGGKMLFTLKKNKPQIMVVGGVILTTTAFVWAICNSRKLDNTMAHQEAKTDDIQMRKQEAENSENELSEEEKKNIISTCDKELSKVKRESAWKIFKLLGIPCIMFIGGILIIIGGHTILIRRFGELSAAFATLQETFNRYRKMNIEEHGEECDRRYRYGIVGEEKVEATITDEDGKEKKVKAKMPVVDPDKAASMYSFVFDECSSSRCPKDPISTISFLRSQEKYWNVYMKAKNKPVTLYMILDELGIEIDNDDPRNDYVMIAGWRPNGDGDNNIDFGIMRAINRLALSGEENTVFLNFNCDGNLFHSPRYDKNGKKVC